MCAAWLALLLLLAAAAVHDVVVLAGAQIDHICAKEVDADTRLKKTSAESETLKGHQHSVHKTLHVPAERFSHTHLNHKESCGSIFKVFSEGI